MMPFMKIYAVKCDINDKELERVEIGKYLHDGCSPIRMDFHQYQKCFDEVVTKLSCMRGNVGDYVTVEIEGGYKPHHVQMVNNMEMIVFWKRGRQNENYLSNYVHAREHESGIPTYRKH